jgi:hypothetical protein
MAGFADHIYDGPVVLPTLKMRNMQFCRLFSPQPATQENGEESPVSFALESIRVEHLPERSYLVSSESITKTNSEVLRPFDPPDTGSEIQAEQSGINGFVCEAPHGCEPTINGARSKLT